MVDPILSLAFSIQSNKGVYALLLGSGVSRSAGIPTGWEVTLDLIRKLAHLKKENCEPEPLKWYEATFSEEPNYSKIIQHIAKTPSERHKLLKAYFEPTEEELSQNIKTPTTAHKAIANLVKSGYIKIILTTNFDRLMEKALEDIGVIPNIISTKDAIEGATPIIHSNCTIIKLHGDYLDTRIKNTVEELSLYDHPLNNLLDRILDEYGLIICGWSGEWDIALKNSIIRCKSRRFTTFWAVKDTLSEEANRVANFRKAVILPIQSADVFFEDLNEKIVSIVDFDKPHPLSIATAVLTVKKYLEEDKYKIRLHDLIMGETDRLIENIVQMNLKTDSPVPDQMELVNRLKKFESQSKILQAMMITGGYWGNQMIGDFFTKSLEKLTILDRSHDGYNAWIGLQFYPLSLLIFSAGLTAIAADNYVMLTSLLLQPQNKNASRGKEPLIHSIFPSNVMEQAVGRLLPDMDLRKTPTSDYFVEILYDDLKEYFSDKTDFEEKFDRLEYIICLVIIDFRLQKKESPWTPLGRFGWRRSGHGVYVADQVKIEIEVEKENWKPLKAGFFGGSLERAILAQTEIFEIIRNSMNWYF
jgi:hypothetical protein